MGWNPAAGILAQGSEGSLFPLKEAQFAFRGQYLWSLRSLPVNSALLCLLCLVWLHGVSGTLTRTATLTMCS